MTDTLFNLLLDYGSDYFSFDRILRLLLDQFKTSLNPNLARVLNWLLLDLWATVMTYYEFSSAKFACTAPLCLSGCGGFFRSVSFRCCILSLGNIFPLLTNCHVKHSVHCLLHRSELLVLVLDDVPTNYIRSVEALVLRC